MKLSTHHFLQAYPLVAIAVLLHIGFTPAWAQQSSATNPAPEIAWGSVCEGFRVAVAFPKTTYTNGEPIIGTVMLRNATTNYLEYAFNVRVFQELIVRNDRNEKLQLKESLRPKNAEEEHIRNLIMNPTYLAVKPGATNSFTVRVDSRFDLPGPAAYTVSYRFTVPKVVERGGKADAVSAPVTLRVQ